MKHRLSKITTKGGDRGTTSLATGERVAKSSAIIDAIGTIDELNAEFGFLIALLEALPSDERATIKAEESGDKWRHFQHLLFLIGGELALQKESLFSEEPIDTLERSIATFTQLLPPLKEFILPSGPPLVAQIHRCRTITRRAERSLWRLEESEELPSLLPLQWLNRLSDYLFVAARIINQRLNQAELYWQSERLKGGRER